MYPSIHQFVNAIKQQRPVILNITNAVTMDFIANGLLSIGASPIMSQSMDELSDLMAFSSAVIINIGTLDTAFISLCERACSLANQLGKPLIFDPVGAGASQLRTQTCQRLLQQFQFSAIRGNASEIMAMYDERSNSQGVDSKNPVQDAVAAAKWLASTFKTVVVISGEVDVVVNQERLTHFECGSSLMPMTTGTGCLLTAVVGAFNAVTTDAYEACCAAVLFYGVNGELAAKKADGPGSFRWHFLDRLASQPLAQDYTGDAYDL